ncbi:hypothetical protein D9M68_624600 [compost metagenome]
MKPSAIARVRSASRPMAERMSASAVGCIDRMLRIVTCGLRRSCDRNWRHSSRWRCASRSAVSSGSITTQPRSSGASPLKAAASRRNTRASGVVYSPCSRSVQWAASVRGGAPLAGGTASGAISSGRRTPRSAGGAMPSSSCDGMAPAPSSRKAAALPDPMRPSSSQISMATGIACMALSMSCCMRRRRAMARSSACLGCSAGSAGAGERAGMTSKVPPGRASSTCARLRR